jgi:glycosyltransferase involved in cell wall biosynthesis
MTFGSVFTSLVWVIRRILSLPRPVLVETYHAVGMPIPQWHRRLHSLLLRCRDALALMAQDPFWNAFLEKNPQLPSQIIPNGINTRPKLLSEEEVDGYRRHAGIPIGHHLVVGTVGRLAPERQPWLLLELFAEIKRQMGGSVRFLLAGDGPQREPMRQLAEKYGISDVLHMPGLATEPALAFSSIDLYVTLNVGPITGVAALEAAALHRPLIAIQLRSDYASAPADWIWSHQDPKEVAAHAVELLNSPAKRHQLAVAQSEHVRAFHSIETMSAAYEQLYKAALGGARSSERNLNA